MGRRRERETLTELSRWIDGVAVDSDAGIAEWVERLQAAPDGATLATSLLRAYRHGRLTFAQWTALTGRTPSRIEEIDEAIGRLWDALAKRGLVKPGSVEDAHNAPAMIRRWAWQPRWVLMEQDEDLLLMNEELVPELLAIAANPDVPKRQYLLSIVAHLARDTCFHALWHHGDLSSTLTRVGAWAIQARTVGGDALAEYLERLDGYTRPGRADREGAAQRILDLERCSAPARSDVVLEVVADGWLGRGRHSAAPRSKAIHVNAATGAITVADVRLAI